MESVKGGISFGESGVDFILDDNSAGECTAKICELFHYIKFLSTDGDEGCSADFKLDFVWVKSESMHNETIHELYYSAVMIMCCLR